MQVLVLQTDRNVYELPVQYIGRESGLGNERTGRKNEFMEELPGFWYDHYHESWPKYQTLGNYDTVDLRIVHESGTWTGFLDRPYIVQSRSLSRGHGPVSATRAH